MRFFFFIFSFLWVLSCSGIEDGVPWISKTIVVDKKGYGNFNSIQAAVDSIADGNQNWILIHVMEGIYWEKVHIPRTKAYIVLQGEGASRSMIEYNDSSDAYSTSLPGENADTMTCATFKVEANDFVARDIGFKNTHVDRDKRYSRPATAAFVGGDRNSFYRCSFIAFQDTLCDYLGRHYFSDCWIEGAVDFIFGYGRSIYQHCWLHSNGAGWLTAQAKVEQRSPGGFVFKYCNITAVEKTYLGRAWNQYATVVFYRTFMPATIDPLGWQAWDATQNTGYTTFVEADCSGPGSDTRHRVKWIKHLTPRQLWHYISIKFIGPDDWTNNHP